MSLNPIQILINAKDNASSVLSSLQTKVAAVAVAVAGYFGVKMFSGAVDSAEALDAQMRKLEAVIQATGGAAGLTAKDIDDMARRLDEATLGSAEGFRDAAAQLLTFKSIGKDAFETTLLLAQDLAAAGFGNLSSNAVQLGKALEDPVKGLSALAESGVTFTKDQQNVIKVLMETGRAAEAQGVILKAVAGQVGGTAAAMGGGLSGAVDLVNKRFKDLQEKLGAAVLPVFRRFNELVAETYKRLTDDGTVGRFGEAIAKGFQAALDWARAFLAEVDFNALAGKAASAADQVGDAFTRLGEWATNAGNSVKLAYGVMSGGTNAVLAGIYKIGEAFAGVASNVVGIAARLAEAWAKIGFGEAAERLRREAKELRTISEGLWSASEALAQKASDALASAGESAQLARDGFSGLTGAVDSASRAQKDWSDTVDKAAKASEAAATAQKTKRQSDEAAAQALAKLRQEYAQLIASGDLQAAAIKLEEINKALRGTPDATKDAAKEVLALAGALKELGITSDADLKRAADSTRKLYDEVRNAGGSAREQAAAFEKMASAAIASGDAGAIAFAKSQAAARGFEITTDAAGKTVVRAMAEAAAATEGAGKTIERSMDGSKEAVDGFAKGVAAAVAQLQRLKELQGFAAAGGDLSDVPTEDLKKAQADLLKQGGALSSPEYIKLRNELMGRGAPKTDAEGFTLDKAGNRLAMGGELNTLTGIANFLKQAGLGDEQAKSVALEFSDGKGGIPYFSNPGQMKYGGPTSTISEALLKAAERTTFGTGQGGAATVGRRYVHDIRLDTNPYPVTTHDDESASNLETIIAQLTRDKRRAM